MFSSGVFSVKLKPLFGLFRIDFVRFSTAAVLFPQHCCLFLECVSGVSFVNQMCVAAWVYFWDFVCRKLRPTGQNGANVESVWYCQRS